MSTESFINTHEVLGTFNRDDLLTITGILDKELLPLGWQRRQILKADFDPPLIFEAECDCQLQEKLQRCSSICTKCYSASDGVHVGDKLLPSSSIVCILFKNDRRNTGYFHQRAICFILTMGRSYFDRPWSCLI